MHPRNVSEIGFCNNVSCSGNWRRALFKHLTIKRGICISNSPLYARLVRRHKSLPCDFFKARQLVSLIGNWPQGSMIFCISKWCSIGPEGFLELEFCVFVTLESSWVNGFLLVCVVIWFLWKQSLSHEIWEGNFGMTTPANFWRLWIGVGGN